MDEQIKLRLKQVFAGAGAGAVTKTAVAPLERLKVLYQLQGLQASTGPKRYHSIPQAPDAREQGLALVYREEGLRGLYRGNGANVVRVIPTYALKFAFNDTFKDMLRRPGQTGMLSTQQMLLAGSLAGMFQTSVTYPLDVIRTRLSMAALYGVQYRGIFHCAVQLVKTEGIGSWYKGFVPTIWSATPYVALQMTFYDLWKSALGGYIGNNVFEKILSGALSGLFAQTVTFPGDVIRRRMQVQGAGGEKRLYHTTWECCVGTWRKEGYRGFFKGLSVNVIRCLPGAGIQFAVYDTLKSLLKC